MESLQKFLLWKDMIRRVSGETGIAKLYHPGLSRAPRACAGWAFLLVLHLLHSPDHASRIAL